MSLAIRKRSWEEHVTQWRTSPFGSIDSNILCRHGLVADNLQESMEKNGLQSEGWKEKSASLPDCCHGGELIGSPSKLLSNVSKEVDENDNHQGEEEFLSLEASTETLVNLSIGSDYDDDDGNDDSDTEVRLTTEKVEHTFAQVEEKLSAERDSIKDDEVEPFHPKVETRKESYHTSGPNQKIDETNCETYSKTVKEEENICNSREESLENHCKNKDTLGKNGCDLPNVEIYVPEETTVDHVVVTAQQFKNSDALNAEMEKTDSRRLPEEPPSAQTSDNIDVNRDSSNCSCSLSEKNDLDENGFASSQNECFTSVESLTEFRNKEATQQPPEGQVVLRKRKEAREDRDQSRLDSMVLLILKLDQLDQDIENALTVGSLPSSTLAQTRKPVPDLGLCTGSGIDVATLSHLQTNIPPSLPPPHGIDQTFPIPMAGSGAKPKAGAIPVITEKEKAGVDPVRIDSQDCFCNPGGQSPQRSRFFRLKESKGAGWEIPPPPTS